jgi:hypothetical protein
MSLKTPWQRKARQPTPRPTVSRDETVTTPRQALRLELGEDWTVLEGVRVPGARLVNTLAVGSRGTLALAAISDGSSIATVRGKPYNGRDPLEPVLAALLGDARAVADLMRGPLAGKPVVHPVLVAPGAPATFTHIDVLVVSPEELAAALLDYPESWGHPEVDAALSTLRGLGGHAVPRSWPNQAPHERSAAERDSIKSRPAPPPSPQPWRDWSVQGSKLSETVWHEGFTRPDPAKPAQRQKPPRVRRIRRRHRALRRALALFVVCAIAAGVWYERAHPLPWLRAIQGRTLTLTPNNGSAGPVPTTAPESVAYPGRQPGDVPADNANVAVVDGVTATMRSPTQLLDAFGRESICATVSLLNGSVPLSYSYADWALQSPTGDVQQPDMLDTAEALGSGGLIAGGSVSGKLCFDDPGQPGVYVLSFRPEAGGAAGRAVWLLQQH